MLVAAVIIFLSAFPIKYAVKKESLSGEDYLICIKTRVTGFDWSVVESTYGYEGYVELRGTLPLSEYRNFYPRVRFNKFVCFGEFVGDGVFDGYEYKIFRVDRWEVLYPVTRDSLLPEVFLPKSWLVPMDTMD